MIETKALSMRGTIRPCREHHHWEVIALLPGNVVAHCTGQDHYKSEEGAREAMCAFAWSWGIPLLNEVPHELFEHSNEPEQEQAEDLGWFLDPYRND